MKKNNQPRLIQTYLPDGTLEGVRIIELSGSSVKAFVIPRLRLNDLKNRAEIEQPSLYLLVNSSDNQVYIGESENFLHRIKTHDQGKSFWDIVVAIVSNTNSLEKSDVKYLESIAVEKAKESAAMEVLNKATPVRNTIHEFKFHILESILEDIALIAESLGFSLFTVTKSQEAEVWYCNSKKTVAKAEFRGDKFVVLSGSIVDKSVASSWAEAFPAHDAERQDILTKSGKDNGETVELVENVSFKSPNHAGGFLTGRNVNAWVTFKDVEGRTMDEVVRKKV